MTTPVENLDILLSRDELVFLLHALKADFVIPGLDPDPTGQPTQEQKDFSLAHAESALRARNLVTLNKKGRLDVQETLLSMLNTCAYPELMISLHHFPINKAPSRTFWNLRSDVIVTHNRFEPSLHGFSMLKDRHVLCEQIVDSCKLMTSEKPDLPEVVITNQVLKVARETVAKNLSETVQKLTSSGVDEQIAKELCVTLAGQHAVSALHLAAQGPDQPPVQEAVTLLNGQTCTWLIINREQPDQISLKVINRSELLDLVTRWTDMVENWSKIPAAS